MRSIRAVTRLSLAHAESAARQDGDNHDPEVPEDHRAGRRRTPRKGSSDVSRLPELQIIGKTIDQVFDHVFADRTEDERDTIKQRFATGQAVAGAPALRLDGARGPRSRAGGDGHRAVASEHYGGGDIRAKASSGFRRPHRASEQSARRDAGTASPRRQLTGWSIQNVYYRMKEAM